MSAFIWLLTPNLTGKELFDSEVLLRCGHGSQANFGSIMPDDIMSPVIHIHFDIRVSVPFNGAGKLVVTI